MAFWLQSVTSGYFTETAKRIELLFGYSPVSRLVLHCVGSEFACLQTRGHLPVELRPTLDLEKHFAEARQSLRVSSSLFDRR